MIPDGRVLGDKTLILLAKLSKLEPDLKKATALLQNHIDIRNKTSISPNTAITNADIDKVLLRVTPTGGQSDNRSNELLATSEVSQSVSVASSAMIHVRCFFVYCLNVRSIQS